MSADTEAPLFELPQRYVDLQAEARALAASCEDVADRADEADRFDPDVRERLTKSGLCEVVVAAEHGGRFEQVDSLAVTVVREALASVSAHLDSMFAMQGIGSFAVSVAGSDAVRKQWLPKVATLEAIAAIGLTEPDVGSDLRAITTTLEERDGELDRQRAQVLHHQRAATRRSSGSWPRRATATRWSSSRPTPPASRSPARTRSSRRTSWATSSSRTCGSRSTTGSVSPARASS